MKHFLRILCLGALFLAPLPAARAHTLENRKGEFIRSFRHVEGLADSAANALFLEGDILYCAAGNRIYAADVSDPLRPVVLSETQVYGLVRQITVQKGILYAACRESGAWLVDVHDPKAIRVITRFDTVELATGIDVAGDVLFLGTRQNGVECVDVSRPEAPAHIRIEKTRESQSVCYRDGILYSGEWGGRHITVIDAHDMASLKILGTVPLKGYGDGVWTWGHYLYAATGHHLADPSMTKEERHGKGHGLEIFDISDPVRPRFVSRVGFDTWYLRTNDFWTPRPCSDGNYVVVADTFNGVYVVDTHDPAAPEVISRLQFHKQNGHPAPVTSIAVGKGAVYVSVAGGVGLYVLDCPEAFGQEREKGAAPANAAFRYGYATPDSSHFRAWQPEMRSPVRSLAAKGDILYVAHSYGGMSILKYGKGGPRLLGKGPMAYAGDVKVRGNILWVAEGFDGLAAYRIGKGPQLQFIARYKDFSQDGPRAACLWVYTPSDEVTVAGTRYHGYYYLDVSRLPEIRFKAHLGTGAGWDKYLADQADSRGWYPAIRHNRGIIWVNLKDEVMRETMDKGMLPNLRDGICLFRGDRFLTCSKGKMFLFSSREMQESRPGVECGLYGMPAWDGGTRLGLTFRTEKNVSRADIKDERHPRLLWKEDTSGYPETGIFWHGKFCVPCGYQGLLIEK